MSVVNISESKDFKSRSLDLDSLCRFRINSGLRDSFSKLCKANHSSLSAELRGFMYRSVEAGTLHHGKNPLDASREAISSLMGAPKRSRFEFKPESDSLDLDANCNFKVNKGIKDAFSELCHDSNLSSELKRFMSYSVKENLFTTD